MFKLLTRSGAGVRSWTISFLLLLLLFVCLFVCFCIFMDQNEFEVHKNARNNETNV